MATKDGTAMTFTRSEVKALLDEAIGRSKTISPTIENSTIVCIVCIFNIDQADNKKSKSNLFSKDASAEKDHFYQLRGVKMMGFMKKVYDLLRKIFNLGLHFSRA